MILFLLENRPLTPVESEVKVIRTRFDDIMSILEARGVNLESTLSEAEQYQVFNTNAISLLDNADDIQKKWSPVSNELITVRRQYLEHQVYSKNFVSLCLVFSHI